MQATAIPLDPDRVTRALLWLFFLADLAGIAWAVRVLVREAQRHLAWHVAQWRERRATHPQALALPEGFVIVPADVTVPRQRTAAATAGPSAPPPGLTPECMP